AGTRGGGAGGRDGWQARGGAPRSPRGGFSSRSRRRAASTTRAPAPSSTRANCAPSPELAPVTIATRPSRRNAASGSNAGIPAAYFCRMKRGLMPERLDEHDAAAIAAFRAEYGQLVLTPV